MELMNLVKAKAALLRKIDGEESSTAEIDRIRAIVSQAAKRVCHLLIDLCRLILQGLGVVL